MKLTYADGQFVIDAAPENWKRWEKDRWVKCGDSYKTRDLRAAFRFKEDADEHARAILGKFINRLYPLPLKGIPDHLLDPHQRAGVRWILGRKSSYLAHAPGAGKTIQAIVAVNVAGGDTLVICPPLLLFNWEREIQAWAKKPTNIFHVKELSWLPQVLGAPAWVLCPDSILHRPDVLSSILGWNWQFLIVDEASRFKEPEALRTRALFGGKLPSGVVSPGIQTRSKRTILLDGSPMPNRHIELWQPVAACSPESISFMDRQEFGFRFCGPTMSDFGRWEFKGATHAGDLRKRLTRNFFHVVSEEELAHPERVRRILFMSEDVRTPLMRKWEKENAQGKPENWNPERDWQLAHYLYALGIRKAAWAARYAKSRVDQGEKVLLFFWHKNVGFKMAEHLSQWYSVVGFIDGRTPMRQREEVFQAFQAGKLPIILGNVLAMGRGVNLQEADRVIFAEYTWSDEVNRQAEKRTSRRGSKKNQIPCDYLACPNSLDEVKLRTLFRKQQLVARLFTNERQESK